MGWSNPCRLPSFRLINSYLIKFNLLNLKNIFIVYTGCRLVFYEQFRDIVKKKYNNYFPLWLAVLVGSSSGALAQFIASPTDLVKVKMQADRHKSNEGPRKGYLK